MHWVLHARRQSILVCENLTKSNNYELFQPMRGTGLVRVTKKTVLMPNSSDCRLEAFNWIGHTFNGFSTLCLFTPCSQPICVECDMTGVQRGDQQFHRSSDDTALNAGSLAHLAWLPEHASDRATLSTHPLAEAGLSLSEIAPHLAQRPPIYCSPVPATASARCKNTWLLWQE